MNEEILKYKDYPEGSGGKWLYDKYTLPFDLWIAKYYTNPDLTGWNGLLKWANEANIQSELFMKEWCKNRIVAYDFEKYIATYKKLNSMTVFDEDINKFIAFMAGEGFFDRYSISLEDWLQRKINPESSNDVYTLVDINSLKFGTNYIKSYLAELDFWKFL